MRVTRNRERLVGLLRDRDGDDCAICSDLMDFTLPALHPEGVTIEHLVRVADGGGNDLPNLALAHRWCNSLKGSRDERAALAAAKRPYRPAWPESRSWRHWESWSAARQPPGGRVLENPRAHGPQRLDHPVTLAYTGSMDKGLTGPQTRRAIELSAGRTAGELAGMVADARATGSRDAAPLASAAKIAACWENRDPFANIPAGDDYGF